jgi:multiple antibiotic resistance protein
MDFSALIPLTISLFLILDPFASLPVFISVTRGHDSRTIRSYANKAILVAGILLLIFILIGPEMMSAFGVTMESFRVAGGIILLLMAVEIVFNLKLSKNDDDDEGNAAWVIVATPILTGPGVITASIVFTEEYGIPLVLIAAGIALVVTWVLLRESSVIMKYTGERVISIASKIIGLMIAALAVEYIFGGTAAWFAKYGPDLIITSLQTIL